VALQELDAGAIRRWYELGLAALDAHREEINALNVFPVADGDTGTNLQLTLESALAGARPPDDGQPAPTSARRVAQVATSIARLSLLGARGSSGVILSQLLRGVAEVLAAQRAAPRGTAVADALERAAALGYAAVTHPVEGTMLTVARAAAVAARAVGSDDLHAVVSAAVAAARQALDETPDQLDVLRRAGVVDAGGRGVVILLEVLLAVIEERPLPDLRRPAVRPRLDVVDAGDPPGATSPAYEVMFLLDATDDAVAALRGALDDVGEAVVVSGGGGLWNVHVHTDHPDAAVAAGARVGHPHQVAVTPITLAAGEGSDVETTDVVVVTAPGSALTPLAGVIAASGARHLTAIGGGADLARALAVCGSRRLVLLTERAAGVADDAARARDDLVQRGFTVELTDAVSPPQLLAALAVHDAARAPADDVRVMSAATAAMRHSSITADGPATADAAAALLEALVGEGGPAELVTVIAEREVGELVSRRLRAGRPDVEVTLVAADVGDVVWLGVE
jgi:DAK2 domain fusion protein YloV